MRFGGSGEHKSELKVLDCWVGGLLPYLVLDAEGCYDAWTKGVAVQVIFWQVKSGLEVGIVKEPRRLFYYLDGL